MLRFDRIGVADRLGVASMNAPVSATGRDLRVMIMAGGTGGRA